MEQLVKFNEHHVAPAKLVTCLLRRSSSLWRFCPIGGCGPRTRLWRDMIFAACLAACGRCAREMDADWARDRPPEAPQTLGPHKTQNTHPKHSLERKTIAESTANHCAVLSLVGCVLPLALTCLARVCLRTGSRLMLTLHIYSRRSADLELLEWRPWAGGRVAATSCVC